MSTTNISSLNKWHNCVRSYYKKSELMLMRRAAASV